MGEGEISIPTFFQRRNALLRIVQSNLTTRSCTAHLRKTRSEFQELPLKTLLPHFLLVFFPMNTGKKFETGKGGSSRGSYKCRRKS
jgi:hypothetical protein